MAETYVNDFATTLNGAINSAVTSLSVNDSPPSGLTANFRIRIDNELMLVTAIGGTGNKDWTVTREAEESSRFPAASHSNGATVTHVLTSSSIALVHGGRFSVASSNPGSPSTGDLCFRTDLGLLVYYDGTRWLTVTLYREAFGIGNAVLAYSASGVGGRMTPWHTTYDIWLDSLYTSTFVATTNDGTKYWTIDFVKVDASNASTNIVSFSTNADTVNAWTARRTAIDALFTPATYKAARYDITKVSTPGNLTMAASVAYRLVVT